MRSLLMLVVALPQIFCDDANSNDNEKYTHTNMPSSLYCNDLNPQMHIDFNMLMGLWHGAEIITHHETEAYESIYDTCVTVHIADVNDLNGGAEDYDYTNYDDRTISTDRRTNFDQRRNHYNFHGSNRRLKLTWDEKGRSLMYTLRVDTTRRGFWMTSGPQTGLPYATDNLEIARPRTMLDLPYSQFTGTVQVMKAVHNHLVLTFCETLPKSQMFTIILTRNYHMISREDVQSIRNLLRRRGLSVQSVRKVCRNSSMSVRASIMTVITFVIASVLSRKF